MLSSIHPGKDRPECEIMDHREDCRGAESVGERGGDGEEGEEMGSCIRR